MVPEVYFCSICCKSVDLGTCKIDEHGRPVHEDCYTAKVAAESVTRKMPPDGESRL